MTKIRDLTGMVFGNLRVIKRVKSDRWGQSMWLCYCNRCGNETIVRGGMLTRKDKPTRSCGCLQKEAVRKANTKVFNVFEYKGETLSLTQLSEKYNIPYHTLFARIRKWNWTLEKSLETPVRKWVRSTKKVTGWRSCDNDTPPVLTEVLVAIHKNGKMCMEVAYYSGENWIGKDKNKLEEKPLVWKYIFPPQKEV